jgi:HrpA-like RNA helicase
MYYKCCFKLEHISYFLTSLRKKGCIFQHFFYKCLLLHIQWDNLCLGEYGCSEEILSIMAMLQVQNVFLKPASGQASMRCKIARRQFEVISFTIRTLFLLNRFFLLKVAEGDLLTLLNVYNAYMASNKTKDWCSTSGLNNRALKRACEIRSRMKNLLCKKFQIPISSCHGNFCNLIAGQHFSIFSFQEALKL